MPLLLASVAASAAGWFSEGAARPVTGVVGSMLLSLVVSGVVFLVARRFLEDLRDGR